MNQNTKTYIGVKALKATPMTRGDYNAYRQWTIPENEKAEEEGYLVEYLDGGEPNIPGHKGYVSWSPKDVFEAAYQEVPANVTGSGVDLFLADIRAAVATVLN